MGFLDSLKAMFGGNARYYHDQLGLSQDEDFRTIITAALWQEPSKAQNLEAVGLQLLGLATGHLVKQTGVQATIGITTKGRLVIGMIGGKPGEPMTYAAGSGHALRDTGNVAPDKVMGPGGQMETAKLIALQSPKGELFQIIAPASKAPELAGWT